MVTSCNFDFRILQLFKQNAAYSQNVSSKSSSVKNREFTERLEHGILNSAGCLQTAFSKLSRFEL